MFDVFKDWLTRTAFCAMIDMSGIQSRTVAFESKMGAQKRSSAFRLLEIAPHKTDAATTNVSPVYISFLRPVACFEATWIGSGSGVGPNKLRHVRANAQLGSPARPSLRSQFD